MVFNSNKATENMLLSATQLDTMYREQRMEMFEKEQEKIKHEQAAADREREAYLEERNWRYEERINSGVSRSERMGKIREAFIAECIYKLYCESIAYPMDSRDKVISRNLVNKFVIENGAINLIDSFATQNLMLSEFARISQKYYDKVLEACDNPEECELTENIAGQLIDKNIVDDFYKELEDIDVSDASRLIKDRVSDAISNFIDTNTANKIEFEEIIKSAQDKVAAINGADDVVAESYLDSAKRKINEMKATRENNVFGSMVESLTASVLKDESLKARYVNEGAVDMEGIVESVQLIYTMLEMVNTTNMVNVDENFVEAYLTNL